MRKSVVISNLRQDFLAQVFNFAHLIILRSYSRPVSDYSTAKPNSKRFVGQPILKKQPAPNQHS
jgi:hypothetical protein